VRNSVKATVDAYDGTVTFYRLEGVDDPIVEAYAEAFPDLFTSDDEMPDELRAHLRYPEDLFRLQTTTYGRYHLQDPDEFYTQEDAWRVARDPGTAGADPTTPVTDEQGQATGEVRAARIAPYYQVLQLPEDDGTSMAEEPEMVMMRPFVPYSEDDRSQLLTAFMAARMDGDHYGELVVYEMSSTDLPDGPGIAAATIGADETVSELENLLGRGGSEVRYGNMLLVPINGALLYVQPFYVVAEDQTRQVPQLQRVIVNFGQEVVIENTLAEALTALFGERAVTQEQPDEPATEEGEAPPEGEEGTGDLDTAAEEAAELLAEADDLFDQADEALRAGDLATYQERIQEAESLVSQAIDLLEGNDGDGIGDTTTTAPA